MTRSPLSFTFLVAVALAMQVTPAQAQSGKALFVASPSLPGPLRRALPRVLSRGARLVDSGAYRSAARGRSLAPASGPAIRRVGTRQGAHAIVVVGFGTRGRDRILRVRYYHGQTGAELRARTHHLRGVRLHGAVQSAILRDLTTAMSRGRRGSRARVAQIEEPTVAPPPEPRPRPRARPAPAALEEADDQEPPPIELPPPVDWDVEDGEPENPPDDVDVEDEEVEEGASDEGAAAAAYMSREWGLDITAGAGFGQRSSAVPIPSGEGRFATSAFPAVNAALDVWVRPLSNSSFRMGLAGRYYTSVGLSVEGQLPDGTTRSTAAHAHSLSIGLKANLGFVESVRAVRMELELGWSFRMLDNGALLAMPTYTLSGPSARLGVFLPLGEEGPLVLGVIPEVGFINSVSEEMAQAGEIGGGFTVGFETQVRLNIIRQLAVEVVYRESHALMSSARDSDMTDVERFGVARLTYRP